MSYAVNEIFFSVQGEGFHSGRPTIFCRFAGCNLWSGLEKHRANAICSFCDTDFVGTNGTFGGKYATADQLANMFAENFKQFEQGTSQEVLDAAPKPLS